MAATPGYADIIREFAPGYDPRHIEAYIRLAHSTLDGLSREQFRKEVEIGKACYHAAGHADAERCAKSFGL